MSLIGDENYIIHNIKNTDTLSGLSLLYDTDINIIKQVNNLHSSDIWSFTSLKIPKNDRCVHAKQLNENSDYYKNAKRYDHIKLLKQLTNIEDDIIRIIYDTTKEQFRESLIALEKILDLQKKLNQDISIIVAHYLVYSDKISNLEDVFSVIEEEVLENKKRQIRINSINRTCSRRNRLESGLVHMDDNCNDTEGDDCVNNQNKRNRDENINDATDSFLRTSWRDSALVHKLSSSLKLKSSNSFSYVKNMLNERIPILNFQNEKKDTGSQEEYKSFCTWEGISFYKKDLISLNKKIKKKRDSPECDHNNNFCLEENTIVIRNPSNNNVRRRF